MATAFALCESPKARVVEAKRERRRGGEEQLLWCARCLAGSRVRRGTVRRSATEVSESYDKNIFFLTIYESCDEV